MYASLEESLNALEKKGELIRIKECVDPNLEISEIHRRIYQSNGPAILFENIKNSKFRACSNIFGTNHRCEILFDKALRTMDLLVKLKISPLNALNEFGRTTVNIPYLLSALPLRNLYNKPVLENSCKISDLPQIVSWPKDGGAFITLPQVISFPPHSRKNSDANIGMYRIQLSGNKYELNKEIGLHYQLHRGIGIHHALYNQSEEKFRISIGIGGPPAYTLASIFPLPEGLSEIVFTGLLGNRRYRYTWKNNYFIPTDLDFCITGIIEKNKLLPEGPFGDHLGYYSLEHPFPVLRVDNVYHKKNAIYPFTVVGRPPQEDSGFGYLIHQMVKDISQSEFPGIQEIHAVDVAGVHPLLLAIGTERYMPFRSKKPEEILTQANHLLGKGQTSLAKYLFITTKDDDHLLKTKDIQLFFNYILERIDWNFDLHFQTNTTMDTLDYSGDAWNSGSKVIVACNREKLRSLSKSLPDELKFIRFIHRCACIQAGILILQISPFTSYEEEEINIQHYCDALKTIDLREIPLIFLVDDLDFCLMDYSNFLWNCFTKSNPSKDIYGIDSYNNYKHWGCKGSLIIDSRSKPHHSPSLQTDPEITKKVDAMFFKNKELHKFMQ